MRTKVEKLLADKKLLVPLGVAIVIAVGLLLYVGVTYGISSSQTASSTATISATSSASSTGNASAKKATTPKSTSSAKTSSGAPAPIPSGDGKLVGQCSTGWHITGYFTPVESDYGNGSRVETLQINGEAYTFSSAFLREVKTEGWGKTHLGNYIAFYNNAWHLAVAPLDARDIPLRSDAIATDQKLIAFGKKVTIPTLPLGWSKKVFVASDIGSAIVGKHIDVYTGEGAAAGELTYKLTKEDQTVCVQ